jgi:drug/metabolite transporter (DMT)-like permease
VIAIFQPVIYFTGETVGIDLTTASESGTIIAFYPLLTLACSAWILRHSPTKSQLAGIGLATAGIVLIILTQGMQASFNPLGYAILFVALFACSLYSVYAEKADSFTSAEKTYVMMGLGAVSFTCMALIEHGVAGTMKEFITLPFRDLTFLIAILYLGIGCSVAAFLLYNTAIVSIGSNGAASFVGVSTIVAETASVLILREPFTVYQIIGTSLVIIGVYIANMMLKKSRSPVDYPTTELTHDESP